MAATNTIPPTAIPQGQLRAETARPPAFPYSFSKLANLPHRLCRPPPPIPSSPSSSPSPRRQKTHSNNGAWSCFGTRNSSYARVRSFTLTPRFAVSVDDVLSGRHLPPLTATEFQDYLIFVERSVENLIFHRWLEDYERVYQRIFPSSSDNSFPALAGHDRTKAIQRLHLSFLRAKQTFFTSNSPYQLTLDEDELKALNTALEAYKRDSIRLSSLDADTPENPDPQQIPPTALGGCDRPPHPSIFTPIHKSVEIMLSNSLGTYVSLSSGNAGRNRGIFAIVLGVLIMALGLLPELYSYSILSGVSGRWIRFAAFAPFWVGCLTLVMGLHGVCIVIFCLGDARQLCAYELARPTISSPINPLRRADGEADVDGHRKSDEESSAAGSVKRGVFPSVPPSLRYSNIKEKQHPSPPAPLSLQHRQGTEKEVGDSDNEKRNTGGTEFEFTLPFSPFWTLDFESMFPPEAIYQGSNASSSFSGSGSGTNASSSEGACRYARKETHAPPIPSQAAPPIYPLSNSDPTPHSPIFPIPHQPPPQTDATIQATTIPSPPPRPKPLPTLTKGRTVFAPLTRVLEPLILRSQWDITMRSALLSFCVAGILCGVLVAVP